MKKLFTYSFSFLFGALLLLQFSVVDSLALDTPLTSPITSPVTSPATTSSSSNSSSSELQPPAPTYNTQAPVCVDAKPKTAPKLISAVSSEPNQVTLVWDKAEGSVTYYLVTYGIESGKPIYGNPNVGDQNTTKYVVKGLSGNTTYYFRVRGGNYCMPGDFSNEIAVKVNGPQISSSAEGFKQGVLSAQQEEKQNEVTDNQPFRPVTEVQSNRILANTTGFFRQILEFIKNLFTS